MKTLNIDLNSLNTTELECYLILKKAVEKQNKKELPKMQLDELPDPPNPDEFMVGKQ